MSRTRVKAVPPKQRAMTPIAEYCEKLQDYKNIPATITDGKMSMVVDGVKMSEQEFNAKIKRPLVPDFKANLNNADRSKIWIHS